MAENNGMEVDPPPPNSQPLKSSSAAGPSNTAKPGAATTLSAPSPAASRLAATPAAPMSASQPTPSVPTPEVARASNGQSQNESARVQIGSTTIISESTDNDASLGRTQFSAMDIDPPATLPPGSIPVETVIRETQIVETILPDSLGSNGPASSSAAGPSSGAGPSGSSSGAGNLTNGVHSSLAESQPAPSFQPPATLPSGQLDVFSSLSQPELDEIPRTITRTGYIYDMQMMLHCHDGYIPTQDHVQDAADGHPEEPMRIKRIFARLREAGLIARMKKLGFDQVTQDQVLLVHSDEHWDKVQSTEFMDDEAIHMSKQYYEQLSLYVCRETAMCARLSCGGVIQACLSVCRGEVRNAFAIVRPPGHHAEPDQHMGFCFFNNVAVAAKEVQRLGLAKKVLILDWDVHHGNGTQHAFWEDPSVLYISLHRHDGGKFYPTSDFGAIDMVGKGAGEGTSVNIGWPGPGMGDADYIYAFQKIVMPVAYEFAPDLVIISAGFDAAEGDILGGCSVTPPAYGHMTHMLCALAGGKVVVALEGGYNLKAISDSSLAVAQVLLGETPPELGPLEASEVATEVIHQVAKIHSKFWKNIDVKACEPPEVENTETENPVVSIADILKLHRANHLFTKHGLFLIPLASTELQDAFGGQICCNVYEAGPSNTLVVFVHDFGNLRVETDGASTTNVHLANSYLLDTSDTILNWITASGFGVIDVNVLAQLPTEYRDVNRVAQKQGDELVARLMRYVWDNYVELSGAENVVLIGHGRGCAPVMDLINCREVQHKVKAVVQVGGLHSMIRIDADNATRRQWFNENNQIYIPKTHDLLKDENHRIRKRLGNQIFTSEQAKVVDVLNHVFPQIKDFVASRLGLPPAPPPASGPQVNGHAEPSHAPPPPSLADATMGDSTPPIAHSPPAIVA